MAWRAAMVLIAFLALADHQYCSGNTEMTLKEQCETRDFQLTTAPSNTFVVPNKANKFNFNKRGKCVVTSRFKCNFGYGFTTDDGMTWAQRIKFELDGSDWIIQNDCIKITTYCPEPDSVLNGIQADSDNNGRALGSTRTFRCEDGYKLKAGNTASIRCTENMSRTGLWTQLPVCEGITCENPGQPTNGQATNTGFDFGKTVRYTCNQGYEMENIPSGVLTVACKGTGLWSQAKPTCQQITTYCPEPDSVLNGIQADSDNNGRALGSTRTFRCEDGYKLKAGNTASIRCTENMSRTGLWTQLPVCEGITCENPGQPANGQATNTGFDFGKTVRYTCNQGYEMKNIPSGVLTVACKGTGLWSQAKPTCQPVTCGDPGQPAHGQATSTGFYFGKTTVYTCNQGYEMKNIPSGQLTVTCTATRQWSQPKPTCQPVTCGNPGHPANGQATNTGFDFEKTVRYTCNPGFKMQNIPSGALTVTCTATRQWSQPKPTCLPRKCPTPGTPASGRYHVVRQRQYDSRRPFQYGDTVRWVCETGFTGNTSADCRADGRWSKNTPTCTRISCQDQGQLANGYSTSTGQQFGSTVTYQCHTGFYMVGSVTAQCMVNKMWSHNKPTCLPRTCPDPGSPTFGSFSVQKGIRRASLTPYLYNDTVTWTCDIGYSATGPTTAVCQATQTWSNNRPGCQRITCGNPGRPENGQVTSNGFDYGKTVRYACNRGYKMQNIPSGVLTVTCTATRQWSQGKPTCLPRQCPIPGTPTSGQYYVERLGQSLWKGPFQYDDIVRWVCDTGFTGNTNAACRADSTWSKNTPTCTRISCQDQRQLTNGDSTSTGQQFGSTVTYRCHTGFYMVGSVTAQCMSNKRWSHNTPTCLPRTCPDPVSPSFGHTYFRKGIQRASLRPYLYNDTVTWICNIGYSATGPTTAVCQATQTWSNNRPDCQRITCGDPGRPENGRATTDGFDYGKRIVYTCDLGYKMQNIPDNTLIVECEETGQWSQPQPTCLPRQCPVPGTPTSGQYYVYRQRYRQRQYVRRGPFQYGDIVKWVCDTGFTGNTSADCRADGTWSKNTPTCTRISCPDPSAPTNGDYTVTGLKYEDTVTYTCRLGYDMQNHPNSSLTGVCMANMMWSRTKPTCENIRRNSSSAKLVTRIKQEVLSTYGSILQALSDLQVVVTNSAQKMLSWS
ncbi:CUB and sushi domain-containing protein 3-like isoform X2 [Sycon ciliatum]|uniref:CUB and sushi domain-containing protein 3-like isoform X2 n=1 Tax=Sycon ciliatum TaxID=27933 RepID=UPI0031F71443